MASDIEPGYAIPPMKIGEPAWAIATFFPNQGKWTEEDYFQLEGNQFIELVDGSIEVLPMPTWLHQMIVSWISDQLKAWNKQAKIGQVLFAPLPLKLFPGTVREPDVLLLKRPIGQPPPQYPDSALMVIEVVSEGAEARKRDHVSKRADYAKAGIPEYWIVDPVEKSVTALKLEGPEYALHGRFEQDQIATSATLENFSIQCGEIWALEQQAN
jgi:Uma2 family endonuclease